MSVIPSDLIIYGSLGIPGFDGSSSLTSAITSGQTNIAYVATNAGSGFPASTAIPQEFPILVGSEIMWVTQGTSGTASGTFQAIRGFAGTTAASAVSGTAINMLDGGPVDFLTRISFTDITAGDTADVVSSTGTDTTQRISLTGRNTSGTLVYNQVATLNGTTPVTGIGSALAWDRFLVLGLGATTTLAAAVTATNQVTFTTAASSAQGTPFLALLAREVVSVTAGATGTTWTVSRAQHGSTATLHNSGDNIYVMPGGDVAVFDHSPINSGTAASSGGVNSTGTTPALLCLQAGQGAAANIGTIIRITNNNPAGVNNQIRYVINNTSYGTDVVAVNRDWAILPTTSTTYSNYNGFVLETVTGAGTGATVPNQITNAQRAFWNDSADVPGGANRSYYQKCFEVNNNTITDFTTSNIQLYSETPVLPAGAVLSFALTTAAGDSGYTAPTTFPSRQTAPATGALTSYVAVTGVPINVVANTGSLVHGAAPNSSNAQGIWLNLALASGTAAYKGAVDIRINGQTI